METFEINRRGEARLSSLFPRLALSRLCSNYPAPTLLDASAHSLLRHISRVPFTTRGRHSFNLLFQRLPNSPRPLVNGAYQGNGERMFFQSSLQTSRFRQLADEQLKEKKRRARDASRGSRDGTRRPFVSPVSLHRPVVSLTIGRTVSAQIIVVDRPHVDLLGVPFSSQSTDPLSPPITASSTSHSRFSSSLRSLCITSNPSLSPLRLWTPPDLRRQAFQPHLLHLHDLCPTYPQTANPLLSLRVPSIRVLLGRVREERSRQWLDEIGTEASEGRDRSVW